MNEETRKAFRNVEQAANIVIRDQSVLLKNWSLLCQIVVDADAICRAFHFEYGLCDQIDNEGNPYPSQHLADLIADMKRLQPVTNRLQVQLNNSKKRKG